MFSRRLLWGTTAAVSLALTGVLLLPSPGSLAAPGQAGEHLSNRCDEKHPDRGRDGEVGHHNPACAITTTAETSTTTAETSTTETSTVTTETATTETTTTETTETTETVTTQGLLPIESRDAAAPGKSKVTITGNIGVSI